MKFPLIILLLLVLCGVAFGNVPPSIPPAYWLFMDDIPRDSTDVTVRFQEVLNLCAHTTGYLRLDSGVYLLTDSIVVPEGVALEGNHSKLQFELSGQKKALCLESNTRVSGFVIDVDSVSAITGDGSYGAPICVGQYGDGTGYSNIEISDLTLHTERIDGNGLFITGNSHDIDITNMYFPSSVNMGRAMLVHWGGSDLTDTTYHPHNIKISNVHIGSILYENASNAGIFLSGVYNTIIENIVIDSCYYQGVSVFAGDKGFEYAHDVDAVARSKGIVLRNILVNYSQRCGIRFVGVPSYAIDSSFSDTIYDMNAVVENCHVYGDSSVSTVGAGYQIEGCRGVEVNNCTAEKFINGVHVSYSCDGVKITNCEIRNNNYSGILVRLSAGVDPSFTKPRNIFIGNNKVYQNCNNLPGTPTTIEMSGIVASDAAHVTIANNVIGKTPESQVLGIRLDSDADSCYIVGNHVAATDTAVAIEAVGYSLAMSTDYEVQVLRSFINNTIDTGFAGDTVNEYYYTGLVRVPFIVTGEGTRYFTGNAPPLAADSAWYHPGDIIFDDQFTSYTKMGWYYYGSGNWQPFGNWEIGNKTLVAHAPADGEVVTYASDGDTVYWATPPAGGADADSIRGKPVSKLAPTDNYILIYDAAKDSIMWEVETGGAGEANTLGDTGTFNETEGFGLAGGKTGTVLKVKGLIEGSNITITKSGDSALIITGPAPGSGFWAFRDSTTIVYVNDSTGDTNVFIQDTTGFRGLRVSGLITDTLTVNNYMKVPYIYGDEVGNYKIRMHDSVSFKRRPFYSGVTHVHYSDSEFITMEHIKKLISDSVAAGGTAIWVADNDTMLLIDADDDTLARFWDDDAGNVCWRGGADQTLKIKVDSLDIGGEILIDLNSATIIVAAGALIVNPSSLDAGHIINQGISPYDLDSTNLYYIFGNAYHVTSAVADSQYMSKKYIDGVAGGGLAYWTEGDDNDTSLFTATGPNTWVGLNDNLTMQGNQITGVLSLTVEGGVSLDDGIGDSPSLSLTDQDNNFFSLKKDDDGHAVFLNNEASLRFVFSYDEDDYIYFDTFAVNVPMISTGGTCDLVLTSSSGEISLDTTNLTTTGNIIAGGAYRVTSAEPDSQFMTKKYIDDAAGGLVAQSVKGDHVDSTAENFVFDAAYETSSAAAANKYLTAAQVHDTAALRLLLSGGALTGAVTTNSTLDTVDVGALAAKVHKDTSHFIFALADPNALYDIDSIFCIKPVTEKAITVTRIDVTCNADPTTEPAMALRFADNFISRTTPTTIDVITTTAGVTVITSGFDDATIPASYCIYFVFTADPEDALKSITVDITYTFD